MKALTNKKVNPELQELRESILKSAQDPRLATGNLLQRTEDLHGSWLFCDPIGTASRTAICGALCTTPNYQSGNWRDFSGELRLTWQQISCIDISNVPDKTELVLRTFCQHSDSTIGHIIKALHKIKRFDAIAQLEQPVEILENIVRQLQEERASCIENGIRSIEGPQTALVTQHIIRPRRYEYMLAIHSMPLLLRALPGTQAVLAQETRPSLSREHNNLQTRACIEESSNVVSVSRPITQNKRDYQVTVFLTFAADGELAARRIAKKLRTTQGEREGFGVLILDENAEKIVVNPEQTITNLFYQVHYIMPILTKGYLNTIRSKENPLFSKSSLDSFDVSYAQYIHDLMIKLYTENNCRNDRFRCVIPELGKSEEQEIVSLLNMSSGYCDPTLRVWEYEKKIEGLACRLARIPYNYYE